jgi:hypothetical protein
MGVLVEAGGCVALDNRCHGHCLRAAQPTSFPTMSQDTRNPSFEEVKSGPAAGIPNSRSLRERNPLRPQGFTRWAGPGKRFSFFFSFFCFLYCFVLLFFKSKQPYVLNFVLCF